MQRPISIHFSHFIIFLACALLLLDLAIPSAYAQVTTFERLWMNTNQTPDQRADELIARMTLSQKIALLHGLGSAQFKPYAGTIPAIDSLGIPAIHLADGPMGVSNGMTGVTAFPTPVSMAASWDTSLMKQYGQDLGAEEYGKGTNVVLAPTVNLLRNPLWGRSDETFGEDPYLISQMAVADIRGIQSQNVIATIKHFAANNQEDNRMTDSSNIDERTLHEIYLPAFQNAVRQANVGAVMCSYNKVNNIYACEQPYLLKNVLKTQWNFPGFVMSDWGATHSTVQAANAGLDMQMPDDSYYGNALQTAVQNGQVSISTINKMVHRILRTMFAFGLFDHPSSGNSGKDVTTLVHGQFAEKAAEQGIVLLQNTNNILPLSARSLSSIAVIGPDASDSPTIGPDGGSTVNASVVSTPLDGISKRAGSSVKVQYEKGLDDSHNVTKQAVALAKSSSVAIVFAGDQEGEGTDRSTLSLPFNQDQLIEAVARANPHTIVVLNTGAPVLMPWLKQVQGVLEAWYAGQENGDAITAVLFGDVNPSGKLPMTFPASNTQGPLHTQAQFPGINDESTYSEKLEVGYRFYDARNLTPLFPFGYGLSYTKFSYSDLSISPNSGSTKGTVTVSVKITNTGSRAGSDVAQLYVSFPPSAGEPPRQLKGFQKVTLSAGQSQRVSFRLNSSAFSYWDTKGHNWVVASGTFRIFVGNSSRNQPLRGSYQIKASS
jgi:beta-glucosidase